MADHTVPFPPRDDAELTAFLAQMGTLSDTERQFVMAIIAVLTEHGEERLMEICRVTLAEFQPTKGEA